MIVLEEARRCQPVINAPRQEGRHVAINLATMILWRAYRRVVKLLLTHHQAHQKEKNAQEKKGKRFKTMLAVREEADEPPATSRKMAPTPMNAAAAGTLIYLDSYGHTEAPAEALALDEEVDYMPDGNIVISRPSKGSKSAEPEVTQRSKGNDNIVVS